MMTLPELYSWLIQLQIELKTSQAMAKNDYENRYIWAGKFECAKEELEFVEKEIDYRIKHGLQEL